MWQFPGKLTLEMAFRQVTIKIALVLVSATAEVTLDGEGALHVGGRRYDEVVPWWNVGVRPGIRFDYLRC
jgi:hypothetical protein